MITLGQRVKDRITNFEGVVVGIVDYISGCNQALVVPPIDKDGKLPESNWFDVQRLVALQEPAIVLDNGRTPGHDREPPKR